MKEIFRIEGMNCQHCVAAIEKKLSALKLKSFKVNIGSAEVEFDDSEMTNKTVQDSIEDAGYKVVSIENISL